MLSELRHFCLMHSCRRCKNDTKLMDLTASDVATAVARCEGPSLPALARCKQDSTQKKPSKDASKHLDLNASDALRELLRKLRATQSHGHERPESRVKTVAAMVQVQKKRSKDASKQVDLTANDALREQLREVRATQFQGYEDVQGAGAVVAIVKHGEVVSSAHTGQ